MLNRFVLVYLSVCIASAIRINLPENHPRGPSPLEVARLLREGDGESLLALGGKLDLARSSVFELELLSGVSDRLAGRIMAQKGDIFAQAHLLPPEKRWLALTTVHGIGVKTAQKLSRDIDIGAEQPTWGERKKIER